MFRQCCNTLYCQFVFSLDKCLIVHHILFPHHSMWDCAIFAPIADVELTEATVRCSIFDAHELFH